MPASRYRYLDLIMAAFAVTLVISNVLANKLVSLFGLTLEGAILLFPVTYIFDDVLTEVYGYAASRRVIWCGFALQAIAVAAILLTIHMPAAISIQGQTFDRALALSPWIVVGSLVAFLAGEFVNSYTLAKLKIITHGRLLWTRTIGSTIVGEAVDTLLFIGIAFAIGSHASGAPLPAAVLWHLCWSVYVVKVAVEIVATPITYAITNRLKAAEGVDHFDYDTDFSPFAFTDVLPERA